MDIGQGKFQMSIGGTEDDDHTGCRGESDLLIYVKTPPQRVTDLQKDVTVK